MRTEQPQLLDRNVNTWLKLDGDRRIIRTLDGQLRVLSDRYRWLDIFDLPENVLPILQRLEGVRFESEELTDAKMYFKVITPASSSTSPRTTSSRPAWSSPTRR